MVPRERIELSTSSLPMTRSTTELPRHFLITCAENYTKTLDMSRGFSEINTQDEGGAAHTPHIPIKNRGRSKKALPF